MKQKEIIHQTKYAQLVKGEQDYHVYETPDLVAILPVLPNGNLLLIEQYRIPVGTRLLEPVTGGINPSEEPELAAIREVQEETGYTVKGVDFVGSFYSAPGYITQKAHVYVAYLDQYVGTSLEEHEVDFDLKTKEISIDDIKEFLKQHPTSPYLTVGIHHLIQP